MAGCQKRGVILPKITSKKVSLFPALTLAHCPSPSEMSNKPQNPHGLCPTWPPAA